MILLKIPFIDLSRMPHAQLRLIFISVSLYLFFSFNLLNASIRTDNLSVSTDQIINSASKLIETSKILMMEGHHFHFLKTAPKGSFLNKLSRKKIFVYRGSREDKERLKANRNNYIIFTSEVGLGYFMNVHAYFAHSVHSIAFVKLTGYHEILTCYQMRRSLDEERKRHIKRG